MYRDYSIWGAELLFQLTRGVLVFDNMLLFIPYIIVLVIVSASPVIFTTTKYLPFIFVIALGFSIVAGMGPIVAQLQMVSECKYSTVVVSTQHNIEKELTIRECRNKEDQDGKINYYGEFGEWRIIK
jgi:hypothetical protein